MSLLSTFAELLHPAPPPAPAVAAAIEQVVARLGRQIAGASGLQRRLAEPVRLALAHCEAMIGMLPGVVDVDRRAFAADPLVHSIFATPQDIDAMLGRSQSLRDFLGSATGDGEYLHALLALRRHEKHTLGVACEGDQLRADVPQSLLFFSDHTLTALAVEVAATRALLRDVAFASLLASFAAHVEAIRSERQGLRGDREIERTHLTVLRGAGGGPEIAVRTRQIAELDARLQGIAESLQPDPLVDALADFLARPEESLRLEPVDLCVDRSGVIIDAAAAARGQHGDAIIFHELFARDRRRHVVTLVRIRRADAERAVAAARSEQGRYLIV